MSNGAIPPGANAGASSGETKAKEEGGLRKLGLLRFLRVLGVMLLLRVGVVIILPWPCPCSE